jgi:hypothetical protein
MNFGGTLGVPDIGRETSRPYKYFLDTFGFAFSNSIISALSACSAVNFVFYFGFSTKDDIFKGDGE